MKLPPGDPEASLPDSPGGFSYFWDVYLPVGISSVPSVFFSLAEIASRGLDRPGAEGESWQIPAMLVCQLIAMVSMAAVALVRLDLGVAKLKTVRGGGPSAARHRMLLASVGCLLLFDIFLNVGVAFAREHGTPFYVIAVVFYLLYLVGIRFSLGGPTGPEAGSRHESAEPEH